MNQQLHCALYFSPCFYLSLTCSLLQTFNQLVVVLNIYIYSLLHPLNFLIQKVLCIYLQAEKNIYKCKTKFKLHLKCIKNKFHLYFYFKYIFLTQINHLI